MKKKALLLMAALAMVVVMSCSTRLGAQDLRVQACQSAEALTDFDVESTVTNYEDGKVVMTATAVLQVDAPNWHRVDSDEEGVKRGEFLLYEGDLYWQQGDEGWTKVGDESTQEGQDELRFPIGPTSICPTLTAFSYDADEKLGEETSKRFSAPSLTGQEWGDDAPTNSPYQANFVIWIDFDGYIVKSQWDFIYPSTMWDEPTPDRYIRVTSVHSGHGEPNILPTP